MNTKNASWVALGLTVGLLILLMASPASALPQDCEIACSCSAKCSKLCTIFGPPPLAKEGGGTSSFTVTTCGSYGLCDALPICCGNNCLVSDLKSSDGYGGNDTIYGNATADRVDADSGQEPVYGGSGDDCLWDDRGNDNLSGDAGEGYVDGGTGTDACDAGGNVDCP